MSTNLNPTDSSQQRPRLLRGKARQQQLAAEAEAERQALFDRLVADLGRPATVLELCTLEQIAARMVRSRRLRAQGRDDREEVRLIAQLLRAAGIRQVKPAEPKHVPISQRWREETAS